MLYMSELDEKCNYLLYFITIGLFVVIGSRMEGHENKRDKGSIWIEFIFTETENTVTK